MNKSQVYASFYDLEYQNKKDDVNFYSQLAQKTQGSILECACGTGRILIPIAQSNKEIWGFDINPDMLAIARQKIELLQLTEKVKLFQDDVTKFSSPLLHDKKFKFIFLPFDSLAYVAQNDYLFCSQEETQQRQYLALKNISEHLEQEGLFVFDIFSPNDLLKEYIVRHHFSQLIKEDVWNLFSSITAPANAFFQIHYFMEILKSNGSLKRWYYSLVGYQSSLDQLLSLLKRVGLYPENVYGSFDLKKYQEGKGRNEQMIFFCRKI